MRRSGVRISAVAPLSADSRMQKHIFRVRFFNQGEIYEVYARAVRQSDVYGFVVIEDLIFGEHTTVVVDPQEERLKSEFTGVKRTLVPMHAVIRIDEVEKEGPGKIIDAPEGAKVTPFPSVLYNPGKGRDKG